MDWSHSFSNTWRLTRNIWFGELDHNSFPILNKSNKYRICLQVSIIILLFFHSSARKGRIYIRSFPPHLFGSISLNGAPSSNFSGSTTALSNSLSLCLTLSLSLSLLLANSHSQSLTLTLSLRLSLSLYLSIFPTFPLFSIWVRH